MSNYRDSKEARLKRCDERIREMIKDIDGVSYGYIGNVWSDGTDDRDWRIFLPHKGIGTPADCIGGFQTDKRGQLAGYARALKTGYDLGRQSNV